MLYKKGYFRSKQPFLLKKVGKGASLALVCTGIFAQTFPSPSALYREFYSVSASFKSGFYVESSGQRNLLQSCHTCGISQLAYTYYILYYIYTILTHTYLYTYYLYLLYIYCVYIYIIYILTIYRYTILTTYYTYLIFYKSVIHVVCLSLHILTRVLKEY